MPILKDLSTPYTQIREGVSRKLIYTNKMLTAVIEFTNGPWAAADPPHSHVHEQITYVAEGDIIFFCEGEPEQRLTAGDMFSVPSGKQHTIQLLSKTAKLIDSFTPVREDFL